MKDFNYDKNSYQIPENYFEDMERELHLKTTFSNEKERHFSVPNTYFNELEQNILEKTIGKKNKVISISYKKWISIASIAACLVFGIVYWNSTTKIENVAQQTNLATKETLKNEEVHETLYETFVENELVNSDAEDANVDAEPEDILYTYYAILNDEENPKSTSLNSQNTVPEKSILTTEDTESEEILYQVFMEESELEVSEDNYNAYF